VVEYLPSKQEALSSVSCTAAKKKGKRKEGRKEGGRKGQREGRKERRKQYAITTFIFTVSSICPDKMSLHRVHRPGCQFKGSLFTLFKPNFNCK
jgi:hypothetical protein